MAYLNYHHLRYFWAIANEGSLTRAARRLNVSPSSLSVQLKTLEDQLGQALFQRRGRTLQLTEAGRIALGYANAVFKSGDELLSTLEGLGSTTRQTLRVGVVATLSRNFQIELLRPLIGRRDVELIIRSGVFVDLLARLEDHSIDLVLANQPAMLDQDADWQNALIAEQSVSLIGAPGFLKKPLRFPKDLARTPVAVPGRGSGIRTAFDKLLDAADIRPVVIAEVDDMAMLRLIAREGSCLVLVPPVVVVDELEAGALVEHCRLPQIKEAFYAITRRRRFPNSLLGELKMHRDD
ncbi:MAG: LysR family transcriptional regulator [Methylocystis sp.]|nr:MAG: LysR family transcriptional regulator [Methylocystis sp.]